MPHPQIANRTTGVPYFTWPAEDAVSCPTCMAPSGEACRNANDGGVAGVPHGSRKLAHQSELYQRGKLTPEEFMERMRAQGLLA